jgi:hypothetical protein
MLESLTDTSCKLRCPTGEGALSGKGIEAVIEVTWNTHCETDMSHSFLA